MENGGNMLRSGDEQIAEMLLNIESKFEISQ